jgi:hypothetical protein
MTFQQARISSLDGCLALDTEGGAGEPFPDFGDGPTGLDLSDPLHELQWAARITVSDSATDIEAGARVLGPARRSLYLILAGDAEDAGE